MDDLVSEFLAETQESLEVLDTEIVQLEQDPNNMDIIGGIFRVMHTIKGTCGFLGLGRLEKVAHASENILDNIRDNKLQATSEIVSVVLESIDRIKELVENLEETGEEPEGDDATLIAKLNLYAEGGAEGSEPAPVEVETPAPAESTSNTPDLDGEIDFVPVMSPDAIAAAAEAEGSGAKTSDLDEEIDFEPVMAPWVEGDGGDAPAVDAVPAEQKEETPAAVADGAEAEAIDKGLEATKDIAKKPAAKAPAGGNANQTIRVNINVLEDLMQMASELVLTRNQLMQLTRSSANGEFSAPLQRLNHITTELQEGVMATRMQPIGNAWAKFPRLVRDLAMELNKKIELQMDGADTELDRQLLEVIKDPLTHMVRNSADHGLESPETRLANGKNEAGTVRLNAFHEGGHIIITIEDDGGGIPPDVIRKKVIQNELATEAEAAAMTDKQILQFIFKAGFSTAEKITSVSGRGVGMDVVVKNIEKIGGHVELDSELGKGTIFTIKIPLTLAIMPVLIVECGGQRYAIPQIRVSEIVRSRSKDDHLKRLKKAEKDKEVKEQAEKIAAVAAKAEEENDGEEKSSVDVRREKRQRAPVEDHKNEDDFIIEKIKDSQVLRLRGALLPLISLREVLELDGLQKEIEEVIVKESAPQEMSAEKAEGAAEAQEETTPEAAGEAETAQPPEAKKVPTPYIVVCEMGAQKFGVVVDRVFDTEEIVVKPTSPMLKGIEVFSGITILGDGSVIMILDPNGLAKQMGDDIGAQKAPSVEEKSEFDDNVEVGFIQFKAGGKAQKIVPLELVSRLEEIDMTKVEWAGEHPVVQYRGDLMRMVTADDHYEMPKEGVCEVVVFSDQGRVMGLVVESITDIVQARMDVKNLSVTSNNGILGSVVVKGKACDLIDMSHYFARAYDDWMEKKAFEITPTAAGDEEAVAAPEGNVQKSLLLVDDSPFFRKFMKPILVAAGYKVATAEDAFEAEAMLKDGIAVDAVITDIDMPGKSGIEFVEGCKADPAFADMPFIALTSYDSEKLAEQTEGVGFTGFVSKADRDRLVSEINRLLAKEAV